MTFTVYGGGDSASLVSSILATNSGVAVDPASIVLRASGQDAVNFYDGSIAGLGIGAGLLLTSGHTPGLVNDVGWDGTDNSGSSGFANGDADIDAVVNSVFQTQSFDATTLEFDFTVSDPNATSISFDVVFGSEEFPEWVDMFVDSAVVMVNGVNYALFNHDPLHPLSVVSANLAAGYFQDNAGGALAIQYDGLSNVLKIVAPINGAGSNHIKIGIADTGDHIYDSGLFIANLSAGNIPGSGVVAESGACTSGDDTVTGSLKDEYFNLQAGNDIVYAGAGDDIVVGGAGNDKVYGGSGADQLEGDAGDDLLDGGADSDTVVFTGNFADYAVSLGANGESIITSAEGIDTLVNVEFVKFKDGLYTLAGDTLTLFDPGSGGGAGNTPGLASISGIGAVGSTLNALVSDVDGIAGGIAYQWYADGVLIGGATAASFLVDAAYAGAVISFTADYTDGQSAAEALTSAGKTIAATSDGDFAIELLQLSAPAGAVVENPLTTLMVQLIALGVTPNEAGGMLKAVFSMDPSIDLRTYDAWSAVNANPADLQALAVEKLLVQIAVITSAGGDQLGMALAQAVVSASETAQVVDLADPAFVAGFIGSTDPYGVINEIQDRNANIRDATTVAEIETQWSDFQSGLAIPVSNTVADLSVILNQAPTGAATTSFTTGPDTALILSDADLVAGFSDPDGDALSALNLVNDQGGVLTANGDGTWTFTPDTGFAGPVELTYTVSDGLGGMVSASALLVVAAAATVVVNHAPQMTGSPVLLAAGSEDVAYVVTQADLLAGYADADGDTLAVSGLLADHGVVVDNGDGSYSVSPTANFHGTVSLSYDVIDGQGGVTPAAHAFALAAVNDLPAGSVSVTGLAKQGQILSATNDLSDADGLGVIAYQWFADKVAIKLATANSYKLTKADAGKTISVKASYVDADGTHESVFSAATAAVLPLDLTLNGTVKADTLNGGLGNDTLNGLAGDDLLKGFAGDDFLSGGLGADKLQGGEGSDIYYFAQNAHHAVAEINDGGTTGIDEVRFSATSATDATATLTLFAGDLGIERVVIGTGSGALANSAGTAALNIDASAVANGLALIGNAGNNQLLGTAFDDVIKAAGGNDILLGGLGNDVLNGGAGIDTASYANAAQGVYVSLALTTPQDTHGAGIDTLIGIENLVGSQFNDTLIGGIGDNVLTGGAGADRLSGRAGADLFVYAAPDESSQANTDAIVGFDCAGGDRFRFMGDTPTSVLALDLTGAQFANLPLTLGASTMAVGEAVLVHVLNGVAKGRDFLLVDANGQAGFQPAGDYAIELVGLLNRASFDLDDVTG